MRIGKLFGLQSRSAERNALQISEPRPVAQTRESGAQSSSSRTCGNTIQQGHLPGRGANPSQDAQVPSGPSSGAGGAHTRQTTSPTTTTTTHSTQAAPTTLQDLVSVGLLPANVEQFHLNADQQAVLLSKPVVEGLKRNRDAGVQVDLAAFAQIPPASLPAVHGGNVDAGRFMTDAFAAAPSRPPENNAGTPLLSLIIKSNVWANCVGSSGKPAFTDCLEKFGQGRECQPFQRAALAQWAQSLAPEIMALKDPRPGMINDSNLVSSQGTSLAFAAASSHDDIFQALKERGLNCNVTNDLGQTPLFFVADAHDHRASVQRLVDAGVDVNHADKLGRTAFHIAIDSSRIDSIYALRNCDADPHCRDIEGKNAFHFLAQSSFIGRESIFVLTNAKVDMFAKDASGKRPIDYVNNDQDGFRRFIGQLMNEEKPGSVKLD
jgi:hypothetical protein